MIRTSRLMVSLPPTSLETLSCSRRSILPCVSGGHVADFVEKQRAAVALLELADAPPVGAGEGASLVAEQLAFQQRFGDGRSN